MRNESGIIKKAMFTGGSQLFLRSAKMLPFGGAIAVFVLLGYDIRRKGIILGSVNSGIDAIPFLGFAKNTVEIFTGDFIPDRSARPAK